ncbi:MAG: choice-of-anchor D domain-containing protein, partial [Candidatus Tenebribacter davisii]|nr:choice-of-anchor D domain-containing protein [Candidatus Tenebribacter davisii]
MKKILFISSILTFSIYLFSQNTMFIPDVFGVAEDTISVSVHVNNAEDFVAIQTDIQLPVEVNYVENSGILTDRIQDHILSISLLENNLLRIFIYSLSNSTFLGNTGSILDFQIVLGTIPGNYQLELIDPIIGNASSQNILTDFTNGNLTLYGPDINLNAESLNFGEVPLTSYADRSVVVSNPGNLPLEILRIYTDNTYFEVLGDTTLTISAGNSSTIMIRFNSLEKGNFQNQLFFLSNDPDEPSVSVTLHAIAFAVNELHVMDAVGSSGYNTEISFTINNMEEFVAFQFDLILPEVLSYVDNSVALSARSVDHVVIANNLPDGVLRIIVYSPSNTVFTGNEGQIVSFTALVDGIGGTYPLNLTNVIISDVNGDDIISDFFSGSLSITASDIQGLNYVNMGETPVTDTLYVNYTVSNVGNDTLHISSFTSNSTYFWCDASFPQYLVSQQSSTFQIGFYSSEKGSYNAQFSILSNDPDENPFNFDVDASAFAPNYISVCDIYTIVTNTTTMEINVDNYEEFVALQVDIVVPTDFDYIQNSAVLTNRANGHILQVNEISANTIRLIAFSMNQLPFIGNSGAVIELDFVTNLSSGIYPLDLEDGVLANSNSSNILKDMMNGTLFVDQSIVVTDLSYATNTGGVWTPDDQVINEMDVLNFSITAYDPDGDPLEYSWKLDGTEVSISDT